jgi:uncharacterized protein (DUF58 family)
VVYCKLQDAIPAKSDLLWNDPTRDTIDDLSRMKNRIHTVGGIFPHFWGQTTPRGRGMIVLLAVIVLLAIATGEVVLYRVGYFLILVTVGCYICVRLKLWRLHMWMQDKSYIAQVGTKLREHVYVRNDSRLPAGWVEIALMNNMPGNIAGIATTIRARAEERLEMHTLCHARGVYSLGPLAARTRDPLGLFQTQIVQGNSIKVMVQPPVVRLSHFRLPAAERLGQESVWYHAQTRTPHVTTIREYIQSDSLNQIHWLSTAKSGRLMSKDFESEGGGDVWVVVDLERRVHYSEGMQRTDECAVAIAASLTNFALVEGHSVGLIAHGDHEYLLPLGGGTKQMSRVLETLTLSKTEGNTALARVLAGNAQHFGSAASLLVVTSSTATEWISVLRELKYHGISIAVVLVNPASFGGEQSLGHVAAELIGAGISAYMVGGADPLTYALSRPITIDDLPTMGQYSEPGRWWLPEHDRMQICRWR